VEPSALVGSLRRVSGACLVLAGITFWLAWFLMPLPGTTDAAFILEQVGANRAHVFASVAVQVLSGALFIPGLLGFAVAPGLRDSARGFAALSLVGIGATGLAADAIYHLLAFEMSAPGVAREAMLPVMERFQSGDLVFVAPQLLALVAGVALLAWAAAAAGLAPARTPRWLLLALVTALAGGALVRAFGFPRRGVALSVIGLVAVTIAELGASQWRTRS